jgi:hypothetical protein
VTSLQPSPDVAEKMEMKRSKRVLGVFKDRSKNLGRGVGSISLQTRMFRGVPELKAH